MRLVVSVTPSARLSVVTYGGAMGWWLSVLAMYKVAELGWRERLDVEYRHLSN